MSNLTITNFEGALVVDSRLIADELGIQHRTLLQTINKYLTRIQEFGQLTFATATVTNSVGARNTVRFCYLNEGQAQTLISMSRNGLKPESIAMFRSMGFDFSMFPFCEKKRVRTKESDYSNLLATKLQGQREVKTLAGNIDILTQSEIIEVKTVLAWKAALGQVLVYGHYYPSHKKRIHLYGETQESFLEMIRSHCSKLKVSVTWEP